MKELQPFLVDDTTPMLTAYLKFDLTKLKGQRQTVYKALTKFLYGDKDKKVLKVPFAAFARYLTDPHHSNLSVKHNTLTDKIRKVRKLYNLT